MGLTLIEAAKDENRLEHLAALTGAGDLGSEPLQNDRKHSGVGTRRLANARLIAHP
jgi:hypothetical protein